jgi:hypothetical protein
MNFSKASTRYFGIVISLVEDGNAAVDAYPLLPRLIV